jgi:hypothetical protein
VADNAAAAAHLFVTDHENRGSYSQHFILFSPNKLKYYNIKGRKGLVGTNRGRVNYRPYSPLVSATSRRRQPAVTSGN